MNAAQKERARELLQAAALAREIQDERRDRDAEAAQFAQELAAERLKVADLQALLDRYQAKQRILREEMSVLDARFYRLRDAINND